MVGVITVVMLGILHSILRTNGLSSSVTKPWQGSSPLSHLHIPSDTQACILPDFHAIDSHNSSFSQIETESLGIIKTVYIIPL